MVVTYSSNIEKWKNELSRRVLDLVVISVKMGGEFMIRIQKACWKIFGRELEKQSRQA